MDLHARALKLRTLIERAPAGSLFHDVTVGAIRPLYEGLATEQFWFTVTTPEGEFLVSVEPINRHAPLDPATDPARTAR